MKNVAETIKRMLFENAKPNELKFVSWTGEPNSFIVTNKGKEYRVEITEEKITQFF